MNTQQTKNIMKKLQDPFNKEDIEWRVGSTNSTKTKGLALPYVEARAIQQRLDSVLGINGWKNEFQEISGGFICRLSLLIDGEWISKEDGANTTEFESIKGGLSSAFKRVASSGFGIGRYLYNLPKTWVDIEKRGKHYFIKGNPPDIDFLTNKKVQTIQLPSSSTKISTKQINLILNKTNDFSKLKQTLETEYKIKLSTEEKNQIIIKSKQLTPDRSVKLGIEARLKHLSRSQASELISSITEAS